jgi:hypothetical protein
MYMHLTIQSSINSLRLVHKQAVLVHVILLDELCKLVGFLCVVEWVHVQDLVSRPSQVSNNLADMR